MPLPNPLPLWTALLLLALPGLWYAGRQLARAAVTSQRLQVVLAPGLALAAWLLAMHCVGYFSRSFEVGLWVGTLAVSAAGVFYWVTTQRTTPPSSETETPIRYIVGTAILVTLIMVPMTLDWAFHDQTPLTGHLSTTAQIQNNIYPPRYITFPEFDLRYHYGFNLLCAAFTALFRVNIEQAIDAVTLLAWGYTWCLLWALGDTLLGKGRGWITALITLFGAGIPFFCAAPDAPPAFQALGLCMIDGAMLNPPMVSYFYQHPWTVGLPIGLCALIILGDKATTPSVTRYVSLGVLMLSLFLCQVVLFVTLLPTIMVVEAIHNNKLDRQRALRSLIMGIAVLALASQLGGLFTPRADSAESEFGLRLGLAQSATGTLLWHLQNFGFLLVPGLAGFMLLTRQRLTFFLLIAGSIFVINVVDYKVSWDILKFAVITTLGLSVLTSTVVGWLIEKKRFVVAGLLLLGSISGGIAYAGVFNLEVEGIPPSLFPKTADPMTPDDVTALTWLRERAEPSDIVLSEARMARSYAQWSGLGQAWVDGIVKYFGASKARIDKRQHLLNTLPPNAEAYLDQGIRWIVIRPSSQRLIKLVAMLGSQNNVSRRKAAGRILVFEILKAPENSDEALQ